MATCEEIIKGAYRQAGISPDIDAVTPREMTRGLNTLQDIYLGLIASGAFGRQNDVLVTADYEIEEQDRVTVNTEDDISLTFPVTVDDDSVEGGSRPPRDGALVSIGDVYSTDRVHYVYDAVYAAWTAVEDLALTSFAPMSVRHRAAIQARLAVRLAMENSLPVHPELKKIEWQGMIGLLSRYDGPRQTTEQTFY